MAEIEECIFCKVAHGKLPAYILFKDDHVVAFHDINPQAPVHVLVVMNNDKPGVIGGIGMLMGENGINIARMQFGRESAGGRAISVVSIDSPASEAIMAKIRKLPNVISVKQIKV